MSRSVFAREVAALGRKHGDWAQRDLLRGTLARLVEDNTQKIDGLNWSVQNSNG